jgi:hypothetical protein
MPDQPPEWLKGQKVFLEIFAGEGNMSKAMRSAGWVILSPIDLVVTGEVIRSRTKL